MRTRTLRLPPKKHGGTNDEKLVNHVRLACEFSFFLETRRDGNNGALAV
jgi:hypothetical protein